MELVVSNFIVKSTTLISCIYCSCVQTLIQSNAVVAVEDSDYNTPLHTACLNGHLKIVKFLLENTRADPEAKFVFG